MNRSVIIAIALMLAILAYFGIRSALRSGDEGPAPDISIEDRTTTSALPEAIVQTVQATPHMVTLKLKGRTAPDRIVTVKAATTGAVVSTPAREGTYVKRGALLCGLDVEARKARVQEAEAARQSAQVDFDAAKSLAEKGLTAANRVAAAQAALDGAEAAVNSARVELNKTQIRAPFAGIFQERMAEAGDFLAPGAACGLLVDLSPIIVVVEVSEAYAGRMQAGIDATATLANGRTYPARVRYVSAAANEQTRTFLVEAELDTGDDTVSAGITATLNTNLGEAPATLVSPALMTLADDGRLGVRYVDPDDTVRFIEVNVIDDGADGAWVTGLPDGARIISIGQEYLSEGVKVTPITAQRGQP